MSTPVPTPLTLESPTARAWRRLKARPSALVALAVIVLLIGMAVFAPLIDRRSVSLMDEVAAAYRLQASQRGVTLPASVGEPALSVQEQEAANLVVEQVAGAAGGGRGGRG